VPAAGGPTQLDFSANRIRARNATARELIRFAYGLREDQLAGGPAWLDGERFDVETGGDGDGSHYGSASLRAFLEDRFAVRLREGTVDVPVYELRTVDGIGPALQPSPVDCLGHDAGRPHEGGCGLRWQAFGRAEGRGITMGQLAATLSHTGRLDRPVVDRTGLAGAFDFDLRFSPYSRRTDSALSHLGRALEWAAITDPLPEALRAQLGLELADGTAPVNVFVVDHVEHPERN
jgi:uncharacterized protein (TIGR03435 family)